jgi:NAD-dependent deacetylase
MKKIIVFSGAGISAESGLKTFRDSDGLWENFQISEVATPEAWAKNPELVLDFYNLRRKQVIDANPNQAHFTITDLEKHFDVQIITQNIDDLHEKAGSQNILHLHGEILKAKSTKTDIQYKINGPDLNIGETCEDNHQLRPDIVWFGEEVPNMVAAEKICQNADVLIIIGTSLSVYPAANIVDFVPENCDKFLIDPKEITLTGVKNLTFIKEKASIGFPILANTLISKYTI